MRPSGSQSRPQTSTRGPGRTWRRSSRMPVFNHFVVPARTTSPTAVRLTTKEYLRSLDDRIGEADDLLEELSRRPDRSGAADALRAERLRLRRQHRGLRLTLDTLEGRRKPLSEEPAGRTLAAEELEALYDACESESRRAAGPTCGRNDHASARGPSLRVGAVGHRRREHRDGHRPGSVWKGRQGGPRPP